MTKKMSVLPFYLLLLLITFFLLFQVSTSEYHSISAVIILVAALAMNYLSTSKNFILILTIIFSVGFLMTLYSDTDIRSQVYLIGEYTVLAAALIIMWLLFSEVKKMTTEMTALRIKADKLEKYIGSSNLLTQSEFANRIKFISTGTQRRGEENYYVLFKVDPLEKTKEAMNFLVVQTLLKTVRSDFDLVTKLTDNSYLVFLQNAKREGCLKVIERVFESLRTELTVIQIPVQYEIFNQETGSDYYENNRDGEV
ncbi:hypothetical protein [Carnobacterium jeotgali]|uniref:hypothetical protein n=1 Tax=Carnobacterium jeotgali TaxID=545534 RepID=UPI000493753A|nr:hypothetical protein [Carnobacterium jeotgali]